MLIIRHQVIDDLLHGHEVNILKSSFLDMPQSQQLNGEVLAGRIRQLGPLAVDKDVVEALLSDLKTNRDGLSSKSRDVRALLNLLGPSLKFVKTSRRESLLEGTELFVLPYRPCLAFSEVCDETGRGRIVISRGMIDLIAASIYDASMQSAIPVRLHTMAVGQRKQPLLLVLNACTALLRYRFYRFAEPLPEFYQTLSPEALGNCRVSVPGALTFLLLHELGHIELGHLERDEVRMSHYDMAFEQRLSDYQLQEAEADEFALDALQDKAQVLGPYWMSQALAFFVTLELISGYEDADHPLAINRHHRAERRRHGVPELAPNPPVANELARRFSEIVQFGPPGKEHPLLETPRADIIVALLEVVRVLKENCIDLTALLPSLMQPGDSQDSA